MVEKSVHEGSIQRPGGGVHGHARGLVHHQKVSVLFLT
jgi:hypothetical protein